MGNINVLSIRILCLCVLNDFNEKSKYKNQNTQMNMVRC